MADEDEEEESTTKDRRDGPRPVQFSHIIDPPGQQKWVDAVGRFILNFGAIEAQTYFWIRRLSTTLEPLQQAAKAPFRRRVTIVRELIETIEVDVQIKVQSVALWDEAVDLAIFRNKVAHSPIILAWRERPEHGEPDIIAILDFQSARGEKMQFVDTIDQSTLNEATVDAVRIAQRLQELLEQLSPQPSA